MHFDSKFVSQNYQKKKISGHFPAATFKHELQVLAVAANQNRRG